MSIIDPEQVKQKKEEFNRYGFTIFRNIIDNELLELANKHIEFLSKKFPHLRPEHYHHPLIRDDAFWVKLVMDKRILDIAEIFLGPNIANFTAHYICKPAYTGQPVLWHQDGAYWNLQPMNAITLWLAIDSSTPENGCLKMIPNTHNLPLQKLKLRKDMPNMLYSEINYKFDASSAIDITLNPGDISVHNPFVIHGSEANNSSMRRCGLDMGFVATTTKVANKDLYLYPLLARGNSVEGINQYRPWPEYDINKTIPFPGCEKWNDLIEVKNNNSSFMNKSDEDVEVVTARMISRLKEGTTSE